MITRLVWTIWTLMFTVLKKTVKLNHSLKSHNASGKYPTMHHFITEMCTHVCSILWAHNIDGLVQEKHSSIANALELRLSCTNLSIWYVTLGDISGTAIHGYPIFKCQCNPLGDWAPVDEIYGFLISKWVANWLHAQSNKDRCQVKNEDVVGAAPTGDLSDQQFYCLLRCVFY